MVRGCGAVGFGMSVNHVAEGEIYNVNVKNVKVMDVYKAQIKRVKQPLHNTTDKEPLSPIEQWIDFALLVKEKQ